MSPQFTTVYQIMQLPPDCAKSARIGLILLAVGVAVIVGKLHFMWRRPNWLFSLIPCGVGAIWLYSAASLIVANWEAFKAYKQGDYRTIEGIVSDFDPMPYQGHQDECFSVKDQRFCYSDYDPAPGFHNTASHGGPIRSGITVRIAYRNGRILRLDVPMDQALSSAESATLAAEGQRQWQQREASDPFSREMDTAFVFTAMCWTLWWNLHWKRVMRFWVKPPNRPWVQVLFRVFFAMNFVGAVIGFVQRLLTHSIAEREIIPTIEIAAIMCVVVGTASALVLWMAERRDAKTALRL